MKRLIIFLALLFSVVTFAQKGQEKREKIKAFKIAFITEKLDLSVVESANFWPVYNTYTKDLMSIKKQERAIRKDLKNRDVSQLTNDEAQQLIGKIQNLKKARLDLENHLIMNLKKVISVQKIVRLQQAERQFRKVLLQKLSKGKRK